MSDLSVRMNLIKTEMAAALLAAGATRYVTRKFRDFSLRSQAELDAGIYTLVSRGEFGYQNLGGRRAMDGGQTMRLIGQFQLAEDAGGDEIEDEEFVMVAEVKAFLQALPAAICQLEAKGFRQSEQLDHPYGWVAFDLEFVR